MIEVQYSTRDFERAVGMFEMAPALARKALSRAVNKSIKGSRTDAVRLITAETTLKAGIVRQAIFVRQAWWAGDEVKAEINPNSRRMAMTKYKTTPSRVTKRRPKAGLRYQQYRSGGASRVAGAFVAVLRSGHVGVFRRVGDKRLPIAELKAPSVQFYFMNDKVREQLAQKASERLEKNVAHEVGWALESGR